MLFFVAYAPWKVHIYAQYAPSKVHIYIFFQSFKLFAKSFLVPLFLIIAGVFYQYVAFIA